MSFEYQNFASLGVNLNRQKYGPLDISNVFLSEADLKYYLTKGTFTDGVSEYWYKSETEKVVPYPYEGQIIATVIDGVVDVVVLELDSEGEFTTKAVGDKAALDAAVAELSTAIDGIKDTSEANAKSIETLTNTVNSIDGIVGKEATDESEATGLVKSVETLGADIDGLTELTEEHQSRLDSIDTQLSTTVATKSDVETAKTEVLESIIGEAGIDAKYDTLKEIADWILSDTTNSSELITRVSNIEKDYLTSTDKTELTTFIDELSAFVGTLPEGAISTSVIAYMQELIDGLKLSDYAKASELLSLSTELNNFKNTTNESLSEIEGRLDSVEAFQEGQLKITSVEDGVLTLTDGALSVGAVPQNKVTGLPDALASKVNKITSEYKGEQVDWTLLSPENQEKLAALVIGDNGLQISGKVNADNVEGLSTWITENKEQVEGLVSDELVTKISTAIRGITVNGTSLPLGEGNVVALPVASATLGLVKSSTSDNKVSVDANGEMEVNSLNVNRLVQTEGEELVLCGGSASDLTND